MNKIDPQITPMRKGNGPSQQSKVEERRVDITGNFKLPVMSSSGQLLVPQVHYLAKS